MSGTNPFDTDASGNIITKPLVGYTSAPVAGMFVLTRLEYADSENHLRGIMSDAEKPGAVQLAITPSQAKELAARLNLLADHILFATDSRPKGRELIERRADRHKERRSRPRSDGVFRTHRLTGLPFAAIKETARRNLPDLITRLCPPRPS